MNSSEHIERLAGGIRFRPDKETDERILASAEAALGKRTFPDTEPEKMRLIIMRNPIIQIAAAAVVVVTCLVGLSLWRGTQSGIALADVLARIEKIKVVKLKWTFKCYGKDPNEPWADTHGITLISQEYGSKGIFQEHDPNGGERTHSVQYNLPQTKSRIRFDHTDKTYIRWEHTKEDAQAQEERSQRQTAYVKDPLSYLKGILNTKYESMGRSTIDGIEVTGFRTTDPNYLSQGKQKEPSQVDVKMWVDVKTLLPVRIESLKSELFRGGRGGVIRIFYHDVSYDFQWDIPVDASEFEAPPIPDGYEIQDIFPESANEENAIEGLKQCLELLGNYPERIDLSYLWSESEKSETPAAVRLKEELKGLTGVDRDNKKMDALKPMRLLNKFYIGLASKDSAYYGKTITPKDADKVLMRWKVSDSEYRVIYGDLHAETVSKEKLAELEAALPK